MTVVTELAGNRVLSSADLTNLARLKVFFAISAFTLSTAKHDRPNNPAMSLHFCKTFMPSSPGMFSLLLFEPASEGVLVTKIPTSVIVSSPTVMSVEMKPV